MPERRAALDREQELRIAALRKKSAIQVHLRLMQLLLIQQPKLLLQCQVVAPERRPVPLELVWDPLTETPEPPACPSCKCPSYTFEFSRMGHLICPGCLAETSTTRAKK